MSAIAWGAVVTFGVFALTAVFYAGAMWQRMNSFSEWRLEVRADFLQIRAALERIEHRQKSGG